MRQIICVGFIERKMSYKMYIYMAIYIFVIRNKYKIENIDGEIGKIIDNVFNARIQTSDSKYHTYIMRIHHIKWK